MQCPPETPFYDGTECIECSDPTPLFNFSSLTCGNCPENTLFISALHRCSTPISTNETQPENTTNNETQPENVTANETQPENTTAN